MKARYSLVVSWIVFVAANGCGGGGRSAPVGGRGRILQRRRGRRVGRRYGRREHHDPERHQRGHARARARAALRRGAAAAALRRGAAPARAARARARAAPRRGAAAARRGRAAPGQAAVMTSAVCLGGPYAADPLPANGRPQLVRGGSPYVEGPVWVAELGALFFSEINHAGAEHCAPQRPEGERSRSSRRRARSRCSSRTAGRTGMGLHSDGNLIACTHDTRSISVFDLGTKARREVAGSA